MYGRTQNRRNRNQQMTQGFQGQIPPHLLQGLQSQQFVNPLLQQFNPLTQFNPIQQLQGVTGAGGLTRGQRRQLRRLMAAQQFGGIGGQQFGGINPYVPTLGFGGIPQQGVWQGPWQQTQGFGGNTQGQQGGGRRRNRNNRGLGGDVRGLGGDIQSLYGRGGQDDVFVDGNDLGGGRRSRRNRNRNQNGVGLSGRNDFTGRGPRNYRRDDQQIQDDVCEILARHPQIDASEIEVAVRGGEVTLRGTVIDRQMKLLAERVIDRVPGVVDIYNEVRVDRQGAAAGTGFAPVSNNATGNNRRSQETQTHRTS